MTRIKGILAAGSLTGLILITMLALGFKGINAAGTEVQGTAVSQPAPVTIQQPETGVTPDEALQAWQAYSSDLENTVQVMQQREAAYQAIIEAANQTILQMQDQANAANIQRSEPAPLFRISESREHESEGDND